MSQRVHLPPIDPVVEASNAVRRRAITRVRVVGALLMIALFGTGARGVLLCLSPSDRTLRAASIQRWDQVTLQARRGAILDRNGRRLATSVATPNVVVDPLRVDPEDVELLAARVGKLLDLEPAEVAEKMGRTNRYARLASRVHPATAAEVEALNHPALWIERNARRYYPEESLASQVMGFVDASGVGREGLESTLDEYLRGGAILLQRRRDRRGLSVDDPSNSGDANRGMDVHTTLDRQIQRMAERALEGIVERSAPESANIVVVEVATGDILAMANAPTFNPNSSNDEAAPRKNHAVQDAIEAGSVFKPFTIAAAVEAGLVGEHTPIDCEGGVYRIGRTRIHDDHPHGVISISEVIKYSSNIGSSKLAMRMGATAFIDALRQFGFGERTGVPLPGERRGVIRDPRTIKPIELATTAFGQGVTSTSMQLAMATASLGNGGVRMKPRLVTRVEDMHGIPELVQRPEVVQRVVSRETAEATARMMVTVTEPGGTATRAQVPGYRVAGKTGTAQKVKDGRYSAARIGSFVGFLPADDPLIAIVVTVDEPTKGSRYGGIVAAPAFAEVAGGAMRYLGVPPDPALLEDAAEAEADPLPAPDPIRLSWQDDGWAMPDLTGRPMREVLVGLQGSGLDLNPRGSGVAVAQSPAAGSIVRPGTSVNVSFQ